VEASFRESLHTVGTEAWRTDLSDVILPLPVYDTSDSEIEGCTMDASDVVLPVPVYDSSDDEAQAGAPASTARPLQQPQHRKIIQPWEEIPPQRVLELMQANEKHGHRNRRLSDEPRPEPVAGVAAVRHLDAATAARELDQLLGGGDSNLAGEPVIVDGLADGWRAQERWCSAEEFAKHYGDMPLKVHELVSVSGMGKGTELWLPACHYIEYAQNATTDAPFYVFQKKFIDGQHDELFEDYECPSLFADDLWDLTPKLRAGFAQHKFFCLGGERTGSALHVDPHFTGAWNTLLCGEKRWVLFPPETSPGEIGVPTDLRDRLRTPCAYWWHDWYPRLAAKDGNGERLGMREVVQRAGETIYVPPGWWHAVLNHGWTIAVTENQLSPQTLPRTWLQLLPDQERSARLARAIRRLRPELLPAIGEEANKNDCGSTSGSDADADEVEFRMW